MSEQTLLLAGDIGGTSTRLALLTVKEGDPQVVAEKIFRSHDFPGLAEVADAFLGEQREIAARGVAAACFGIAGPVRDNRVSTPNLPWHVDGNTLKSDLRIPSVAIINDLEANAYGIPALGDDDIVTLQAGREQAGNRAVIAAGTGLGVAGLYWDGRMHRPFATESGHADFSPRDEMQAGLIGYLMPRWGHVSLERVLSGPGLYNIYQFVVERGYAKPSKEVAGRIAVGDSSAEIATAAHDNICEACSRAVEIFDCVYASEAGNLALRMMAYGGVYFGGGIAPKMIDRMRRPSFIAYFSGKGRMQGLLDSIPLRVILNPLTALLGAGRYAALMSGALHEFEAPSDSPAHPLAVARS